MNAQNEEIRGLIGRIRGLLDGQRLGVLASHSGGRPHGSLVAFAATDDLRTILFSTTRATRKYANISSDARVALVVDDRSNEEWDFSRAAAVTVSGEAREVGRDERPRLLELFLRKHPYLREFVTAPSSAFLKIDVRSYSVVTRFQDVRELEVGE